MDGLFSLLKNNENFYKINIATLLLVNFFGNDEYIRKIHKVQSNCKTNIIHYYRSQYLDTKTLFVLRTVCKSFQIIIDKYIFLKFKIQKYIFNNYDLFFIFDRVAKKIKKWKFICEKKCKKRDHKDCVHIAIGNCCALCEKKKIHTYSYDYSYVYIFHHFIRNKIIFRTNKHYKRCKQTVKLFIEKTNSTYEFSKVLEPYDKLAFINSCKNASSCNCIEDQYCFCYHVRNIDNNFT